MHPSGWNSACSAHGEREQVQSLSLVCLRCDRTTDSDEWWVWCMSYRPGGSSSAPATWFANATRAALCLSLDLQPSRTLSSHSSEAPLCPPLLFQQSYRVKAGHYIPGARICQKNSLRNSLNACPALVPSCKISTQNIWLPKALFFPLFPRPSSTSSVLVSVEC